MATYGLGVDLGTTYTAAAIWRAGRAESVPLGVRAHTVPSVLFLREDGVMLVGEAAARRGATEPERVAREFKRRFGDGIPVFLDDREFSTELLAGQLLRWVVETVVEREGGPPAHVTLTHPASWGQHRTDLLVTAAEQAGLADVGLLPEPVAAAAYYASTERLDTGRVLAVYDLGGGTFDATVVRKTPTGFAVEGEPGGDDGLGGVDFDQVVMDHVVVTLGPTWRALDLEDDAVLTALARVRADAVDAKEALSLDVEATVPVILPGTTRDVRITRGEFESAIRIPLLRTVDLMAQAMSGAGVAPAQVHAVLLVGGSSRIPLVSRLIAGELGIPVALDAHPKYAVCLGAAIAAGARIAPPAEPADRPAPPPVPEPVPRPASPPVPEPAPTPIPRPAPAIRPAPVIPPPARSAAVDVDLRRSGITEVVDTAVPTTPEVPSWAPPLSARDEPVTVTHVGDRRRGRRAALLTAGAALLAVLMVTVVALLGRPATPGGPAGGAAGGPVAAPDVVTAGRATLVEGSVVAAVGDRMRGVTPSGGRAVAVGGSDADGTPRAWRSDDAGGWATAQVVGMATTLVGGMNGVTGPAGRGELVAVGWVAPRPAAGVAPPTGAARQAAVWTSTDGAIWTLRTAGDLGTGVAGLGELYDVAVDPSGGFVAAGADWSADPRSGDGAVLRSADARTWQAQAVTGLDGLGPTTVRGLLAEGNGLVAVGSRLQAGSIQAVVWTSPDGIAWSEVAVLAHLGPGAAEATGAVRLPGGAVLVSGSSTALDGTPGPVIWSGPDPAKLRPVAVEGAGGALEGLAVVGDGVAVVGTRTTDAGPTAAAWTVDVVG